MGIETQAHPYNVTQAIQKGIHERLATLFIFAKTWKQSRYPLKDE